MKLPILLNNWEGKTPREVFAEFSVADPSEFAGVEILLASYGTPPYEGYAFVLFRRDGKLYEVNGSHCSCYGLEEQWDPEETTIEAIRHRVISGNLGAAEWECQPFATELLNLLTYLEIGEDK